MADSSPWQLYVFATLQLLGAISACSWIPPDVCKMMRGKPCNGPETVLSDYNSIWLLSLAVLFFLLTIRNRQSAEKIKRLAYFAIYCTVASLAGILLEGSSAVTGIVSRATHLIYLIVTFLVFFMLVYMVNTDSPMVATTTFKAGLGLNVKGYLVLYTILLIVWIFYNSDFQPVGTVFESEDLSKLARLSWNWWSVLVLENSFVYMYAMSYGDEDDQEAVTIATVFILIVATLIVWGVRGLEVAGIVKYCFIQNTILVVLALLAVGRYRMQKRGGYEPVSSSNVV